VNESYVSVSANPNRDEVGRRSAQDQSFNSHQSKKSRTHKLDVSAKRATVAGIQDKENTDVAVISTTPKTINEAFDAT
jgi:saccharopine dehydrogenase-like NADP-dependent oxidoreductase